MKKEEKSLRNIKKHCFYYGMLLIPILQFLVFYVYANLDSFAMAFSKYSYETNSFTFVGLDVFKAVFNKFDTINYFWDSTWRSVLLLAIRILVGMPLPLIFSYYLYKKSRGYKFFKVVLFLPTMLSTIVVVTIFRNFVEYAAPELGKIFGLKIAADALYDTDKAFNVVMLYYLLMSMGSQIILYTGAMSAISDSVIDAGAIDGVGKFREFVSIVIPCVWQTIITFVVISIATTFTEMMCLYDFYGGSASEDVMTIGYYLYKVLNSSSTTLVDYPELSALGLLFTVITCPVVLLTKWALGKFGPREE